MKKRQTIKKKLGLVLLAMAALMLAIFPIQARAQDMDFDGFTDQQEWDGITLTNQTLFPGFDPGYPRDQCLDPGTRDLFVFLVPATPSNLPANPLEFVSKPEAEGGLAITCHVNVIDPNQADPERYVCPSSQQKAVRITESLDPNGDILGTATYGTPNYLDKAVVYTERIKNHVNFVCADATECYDVGTGKTGIDLINHYICHTIAHETGHMMVLAVEYNNRFGGYHYKSGSEVIMEQSIFYTDKKGVVKWYISTNYAEPSIQGARLK